MGAKINQKIQKYTGHNLAEVGGLMGGAAGVGIINDAIHKYLPASVSNIINKAGLFAPALGPLIIGCLGQKYGKGIVKEISKGIIGAGIVGVGQSIYMKAVRSNIGMGGVEYFPNMGDVEYFPNKNMGDVEYFPKMGASEFSDADFGASEFSDADFGASEFSDADFGEDIEDAI